jgi:hypothetical protein
VSDLALAYRITLSDGGGAVVRSLEKRLPGAALQMAVAIHGKVREEGRGRGRRTHTCDEWDTHRESGRVGGWVGHSQRKRKRETQVTHPPTRSPALTVASAASAP